LTIETSNDKGEIERKFFESKNLPNFGVWRGLEVRDITSSDFTTKFTSFCESTSFKPFCVFASKSVEGSDNRPVPKKCQN